MRGQFGFMQLFVPFDLIFLEIYSKEIIREAFKSRSAPAETPLSLRLKAEGGPEFGSASREQSL